MGGKFVGIPQGQTRWKSSSGPFFFTEQIKGAELYSQIKQNKGVTLIERKLRLTCTYPE